MIIHEWRSWLDDSEAADVRALADQAAGYDEEAGFSRIVPVVGESATVRRGTHHVLVRVQPHQPDEHDDRCPLAAYLSVDVDDAVGTIRLVVHPEYRSLGIGTLTFEKLGVPPAGPDGWCGTGAKALQVWADGDHPAAERMARRFGAERVSTMWQVCKRLSTVEEWPYRESPPGDVAVRDQRGDPALAQTVARVEREGRSLGVSFRGHEHLLAESDVLVAVGPADETLGVTRLSAWHDNGSPRNATGTILTMAGAIGADPGPVSRALLLAAVTRFRERGIGAVRIHIDADAEVIVGPTRELGFEHERTDVCYRIG